MAQPHFLENNYLKVGVRTIGAELTSIYSTRYQLEYLWQGNPAYWAKQSPVLFPIVGTLRDNTYQVSGSFYSLSRHGFARDHKFNIEDYSDTKVTFFLKSGAQTLTVYPYQFELRIIYELHDSTVLVSYQIRNITDIPMYFSIGAHPAFNVPLENDKPYEAYYLKFEKKEFADRWPITDKGLISKKSEPFFAGDNILALSKSLFSKDALVFKDLASRSIVLESENSHGIRMEFAGFPYFGIWAAKHADFICLEPWCGIADSEEHSKNLYEKEGINVLEGSATFERTWSVTCY